MFRRLLLIGILALLPALAGCMHFVHKPPECDEFVRRPSDVVPEESKSCVYVFLIDPLNPFVTANTTGLRDHLQKLGFGKTFYGQSCHASYFLEKMHAIQAHCGATARFVVIGYDRGCDSAQMLASSAARSGTAIDRLICLEPRHSLVDEDGSCITIRAVDLVDSNTGDNDTQAIEKSGLPTHPKVIAIIERELSLVAMTVPPPKRPDFPKVQLVPPVPAPRDTPARPKPLDEDWQFLQPKEPWESRSPTLPAPTEPLPLPKMVPELPSPKSKR